MIAMYLVIHLNAGYTTKGNPRKLYTVYYFNGEAFSLVDVIEEGYEATTRLKEKYQNFHLVESFEITPKEFKQIKAKLL